MKIFVKRLHGEYSSFIEPQSLPPTKAAAKYHNLQAYYQIQIWRRNKMLKATDWGWKINDNKFKLS